MYVAAIEKRLEKHAGKNTKKKASGMLENDVFIIPKK